MPNPAHKSRPAPTPAPTPPAVADLLRPDPANPNRMDAATKGIMARSLAEFGDLS